MYRALIRGLSLTTILALSMALAPACSDDDIKMPDAGKDAGPDGKAGDASPDAGKPCKHKVWTKGTQAFKEAKTWKLESFSGVLLTVGDIDGDGWADLVPRFNKDFAVLRNTGKGAFEDVTKKAGLNAPRSGTTVRKVGAVSFADVDNDGDQDAFTGVQSDTGGESELMINSGDGTFKHGDSKSPLRNVGRAENPAGGSFIDYDLDGKLDIWVPHNGTGSTIATVAYQDRLYKGDGKGGFTEATSGAGLTTLPWSKIADLNAARSHTRAWSALACDLNNDGLPELLASSYGRAPNHLWQAKAGGGFTNRSVASGYAYDDNKNWQDNQFARCYCKSNPSATGCSSVKAPQISCTTQNWVHSQDREAFRLGGNSASTTCADLNNDGYMDLVTGEIKHWWAGPGSDGSEVLLNSGKKDVAFTRPGDKALGLEISHSSVSFDEGHMTQAVLDFDNDGLLDIYQGDSDYPSTRGRLYHQVKHKTKPLSFEEVSKTDGIDHNRSHGVVVADFDRDGDLDLIVGHSHMRCGSTGDCYKDTRLRFFENVIGNKNSWIQLQLVGDGKTANRSAIGARVQASACNTTQTQQVGGGHGHFGSQHDMVLHFGLGDAAQVKVTVTWPDKAQTRQTFTLDTKKRYKVEMGKKPTEVTK